MQKDNQFAYELEMKVRDYECDIQGIVNNANYLHYLEYTRHEFLESLGLSFSRLHAEGVDAVVSSIQIKYKNPLAGGDEFFSCMNIRREGVKLLFLQEIQKKENNVLCCQAEVAVVVLIRGRLSKGDYFDAYLKAYL